MNAAVAAQSGRSQPLFVEFKQRTFPLLQG